ncbi:hypothetical protein K1X12_06935 [Hyphomonas sp. WL0036]|uniref:hypothetical protein n=1 Tax=Hyphomonas sediminis TaxID=2866160 RepID=UPI001C81E938|nr:hypothetical protein [Hyphomonas sediminis]MBY9066627.1 hypothetical protein [Hyphomonas sediminis]
MARRSRYAGSSRSVAEVGAPSPPTIDKLLEDVAHELKLIDIKRRAIDQTTARLPWLYIGATILGVFLAGSVLAISPVFIFLFGALFSGVMANITGPLGALTYRRRAYREIAEGNERIFPMISGLPGGLRQWFLGSKR